MEIEELGLPYAGELFQFMVTHGTGPTHIEAYIDRRKILVADCPDPPCHEMISVPPGTKGADLWIVAEDAHGNAKERRFTIGESDTSAGGTISTAR
jgi:hypothetical protein